MGRQHRTEPSDPHGPRCHNAAFLSTPRDGDPPPPPPPPPPGQPVPPPHRRDNIVPTAQMNETHSSASNTATPPGLPQQRSFMAAEVTRGPRPEPPRAVRPPFPLTQPLLRARRGRTLRAPRWAGAPASLRARGRAGRRAEPRGGQR